MIEKTRQHETVVVGLGQTGLSCARFLAARGKHFAVVDSRQQPPELDRLRQSLPDVPLYLGGFDQELLCRARELILSPGVAVSEPAIQAALRNGVSVTGDIELFIQQAKAPVLAITGSNGKSTVTSLVGAMIEQAGQRALTGGNIGTPALDLLSLETPDFYVLELSSFQLETVSSLNAVAAAVLNVSEDHMDRYPNLAEYAKAKEKIYQGTGYMIINHDDAYSLAMRREVRNVIGYTLGTPADAVFGVRTVAGKAWLAYGPQLLLPEAELALQGKHNVSNALAALALGTAIGLPMSAMLDGLKTFRGLPHRCQWLGQINGVDWIDDSKGTNVGATCAAIHGLAGKNNLVLIAGGEGKGADFTPLRNAVQGRAHTVILIGRDADKIASALAGCTRIVRAITMQAAVQAAAEITRPGQRVLLSPACASFDMFRDYKHRGEVFAAAVDALRAPEST